MKQNPTHDAETLAQMERLRRALQRRMEPKAPSDKPRPRSSVAWEAVRAAMLAAAEGRK